jgi:hypothetical protein
VVGHLYHCAGGQVVDDIFQMDESLLTKVPGCDA